MKEFESVNGKPNFKKIFLVMSFFLIGWFIMFMIALYEEKLETIFNSSC